MGRLELRFFPAELWLLVAATVWTAAYLLWWRARRPLREQLGLAALALLVTTPPVISGVTTGYADVTGSILLAVGALAAALWLDGATDGHLWLSAILLAAGANAKDEDLLGAILVLLALGVTLAAGRDWARLRRWLGGCAVCAALLAPWRLWTAVHGLRDSVQPALPHALNPVAILDRFSVLREAARAMFDYMLIQWGWQPAIFLALCVVALVSGAGRRLAVFYLLSFMALFASLLWLYTMTTLRLAFLIHTSVARTVDVFMVLTAFASAHLLASLLSRGPGAGPATAGLTFAPDADPESASPPHSRSPA